MKPRIQKSPAFTDVVTSLLLSSVSLQGISGAQEACAQAPAESPEVRLKYTTYKDFQGNEDRMQIETPMVWFQSPVGDSWDVTGSLILDSVSGASPYYLDTLSGASGKGIHDQRTAGNLKFTKYFEQFSVGVGGAISDENDYHSDTPSLDIRSWNSDKSRVYALGISGDFDSISSTNDPLLEESRTTGHYFAGVTQVINAMSVIQSNLSFSSGSGYYTDPYKLFDNRPQSRQELAWLNRYVLFIPEADSSLHFDYRLYGNSWGLYSHMFDVNYYQPIGEYLILRPGIRYYLQNAADFFSSQVPPLDPHALNSADQRLSSFGDISSGVKAIVQLTKSLEIDAEYLYFVQDGSLRPGGTSGIKTLGAHFVSVGLLARF